MATTLQKWGNSLAVRLPKDIAERRGLREGSRVVVAERGDTLVIRPDPNTRKKLSLDVLLGGITPDTLHQEVVWGALRGNEVW